MNGIRTGVNGDDIIGENTLRSPCLLNKLTHSTMQYASRNDGFSKSEISNLPSELWNTFQLQRRQKQISKVQYPKKRLTIVLSQYPSCYNSNCAPQIQRVIQICCSKIVWIMNELTTTGQYLDIRSLLFGIML